MRAIGALGSDATQRNGAASEQMRVIGTLCSDAAAWRDRLAGRRAAGRRWLDDDVIDSGIWRVRPHAATAQAALWSPTDREAALMIVAPIQQRIARAEDVADALERVRRDKRRALLRAALTDVADGVLSLNELDFAGLCRRRGPPEPDRQVVIQSAVGRSYLDVRWRRWRVVVEVDGVGSGP